MRARLASTDDVRDRQPVCCAPSCWSTGSVVEIVDDDVENPPVLCETHAKCYLGVST